MDIIKGLGGEFTTKDVIENFKRLYREDYERLVQRYGCEGGRGSGKLYTPHAYLARQIANLEKKGWIQHRGWKKTQKEEWTAPKVKRWCLHSRLLIV